MDEQTTPLSPEAVHELLNDAVRWVIDAAPKVPHGVRGIVALVPFRDPTKDEVYVIRVHGTPSGTLVLQSPWLPLLELDPKAFEKNDDWWKELGL